MSHHNIDPRGDIDLIIPTTVPYTRIKVSSAHLILSSPYFKALLTGNFTEAHRFQAHGHLVLTLHGDDAESMIRAMKVVHGKYREIPGNGIRLDVLANMCVIIDKYELFNSVCTIANTWVTTVRPAQYRVTIGQTLSWLFTVMWALNLKYEFKWATKALIREYGTELDLAGTCVPTIVNDSIINERRTLLAAISLAIGNTLNSKYIGRPTFCNAQCDAHMTQNLSNIRRLARRSPTSRLKPCTIKQRIETLLEERNTHHQVVQNQLFALNYVLDPCIGELNRLKAAMDQLWTGVQGQELDQLKADANTRVDWLNRTLSLPMNVLWPMPWNP